MIWWIVVGVVVLALVILAVVVFRVLGGARELRHVRRALQRRAADGRALQANLDELRQRAEALQAPIAAAQDRVAIIQARRGDDG